jgi:tetratricopeptide (TPR) repeat protein/tRNA A-37 threonylcarbamoyl transferase component Bud32
METSATESGDLPADPLELAVGDKLGDRYSIVGFLGRGGMGAVYRARDEKLGEDVALKVVRTTARLRDEVRLAQKVTHPNVCRTFDLEEIAGRQLVKMEYVEGETLAVRLVREPRLAIDEAVRIARAIAAGLVAAHEQGIVHRDLKPGNVMLAGARVVLMDFGIARQTDAAGGAMAGTLGYMAPEQLANWRVDGRADWYALGCLLYEMVAGQTVFKSPNKIELAARHVATPPPDVREARPDAPRWLARAIDDLLAKDPAPRTRGLDRLEAGPRRIARRLAVVGALVAVGAGAVLVLGRAAAPCQGFEQRLTGVWDAAVKQRVHDGFARTKLPFAEQSFAQLVPALDRYASVWTAQAIESCQATRVRGDQTEDVLSLRSACLDQHLEALGAVARALAEPTKTAVEKGGAIANELEPLAACANVRALRSPLQPPPEQAAAVAELDRAYLDAAAQLINGNYVAAGAAAIAVSRRAKELGFLPAVAKAEVLRATSLAATGTNEEAARAYAEAARGAIACGDDLVVMGAALSAADLAANVGKPAEARIWLAIARAEGAHLGGALERSSEFRFDAVDGVIEGKSGNPAAAVAAHERALAGARSFLEPDSPELWRLEADYATSLSSATDYVQAAQHLELALALREKLVGPDHADLALVLSQLGLCYGNLRDPRARSTLERALAIRERVYGKNSPLLVPSLNNLADALVRTGDAASALAPIERAVQLAKIAPGEQDPDYHVVVTTRGEVLTAMQRYEQARAVFDEVLALEDKSHSATLPVTETSRAELALAMHAWPDAARHAERAVAGFEAAAADNPQLWHPLTVLARAEIAQGHVAAARPLLERALAIAQKVHLPEEELAPTREALAKLPR